MTKLQVFQTPTGEARRLQLKHQANGTIQLITLQAGVPGIPNRTPQQP
jgi:hypothetical protein